jgi:acyl-CoA synthetase (AMP-forming)/AMP-acid ligase II
VLAVRSNGDTVDLAAAASRVRRGLPRALEGRVVAIALHDPVALLAAVLAVLDAGGVAAPLDVRAPIEPLLARARPLVTITDGGLVPGAEPRALPPEAALLLHTSGSSGAPKGVVLGRAGLRANIDAILGYLPIAAHPRTGIVLPLFYSYALVGQALATRRAGGSLVLANDVPYPALQLEVLARAGAQGLSSVPTSLRLLARAADPPLALGYVASAGGRLDETTVSAVRRAFPGARLYNQYGLTEASPRVTAIADDDPAFARGSVGRPLPGITVSVDGDGEVWVHGPSLMLGYLDEPPLAGPLRTGDRGRLEDGYLWVDGRGDGVVKCAGERVSLEEVAIALRAAPGVADAAVVAVPDELLGVRLVAFVEGDAAAARRAGLELMPAKRPARVVAVDALPRLASGKVALAELRARAERNA